MLFVTQMTQTLLNAFKIVKKVGDEHDQAAMRELFGDLVENLAGICLIPPRHELKLIDNDLPLSRRIAGLEISRESLIENRQAHRILLLDGHVTEGSSDGGGVVVFGPSWRGARSQKPGARRRIR